MSTGAPGPITSVVTARGARDLRHLGRQLGRRWRTENHADEARHLTVPAEQRLGRRRARRHSAAGVRARPEVAGSGADRSGPELAAAGLRVCAHAAQARGDDDDDRPTRSFMSDRLGVAVAATSTSKSPPPNQAEQGEVDGSSDDDRHRLVGGAHVGAAPIRLVELTVEAGAGSVLRRRRDQRQCTRRAVPLLVDRRRAGQRGRVGTGRERRAEPRTIARDRR